MRSAAASDCGAVVAPANSPHNRWSSALCGAVLSLCRQERGRPALLGVAHALERLRPGTQLEQGAEPLLVGRVLERLVAGEDGGQRGAVHEGSQDEVDEAALVAPAAPAVEASSRILVEGAVTAAERAVVAVELCEPHRHPQLGARAEVGEHGEARPQCTVDQLPEAAFELLALGPLVVHGTAGVDQRGHGRRPLVGEDHGVPTLEDRGHHGGAGEHGGDRDVPVEETELLGAPHEGIDLAGDAGDRQAGHRRRVLDGREALRGWRHDAQRGARVVRCERLHRHDGVDAAAEGDQRPARFGVVGHGRRSELRRGRSGGGRAGPGRCGRRTRRDR